MRLRRFDHYARIIQRTFKHFCTARLSQKQREEGKILVDRRSLWNVRFRSDSVGLRTERTPSQFDQSNVSRRLLQRFPTARSLQIDSASRENSIQFVLLQIRPTISSSRSLSDRHAFNLVHHQRRTRTSVFADEREKLLRSRLLHVELRNSTTNPFGEFGTDYFEVRLDRPFPRHRSHSSSEYFDNLFLIAVKNEFSTLLELSTKTEAIYLIEKNYRKRTRERLLIAFCQR